MTAAAIPATAPAQVLQCRYSVEGYLEIERKTNQRHIFINGLIYLMAGAKPPHLRISGNVFGQLYNALENRVDYEVFNSETKIYLPRFNYYYYPDALVMAGKTRVCQQRNRRNPESYPHCRSAVGLRCRV
ncbi:MAG: Uma2 family endonuclease [Saprospiraceae bacterium]|nr:Uma2 family endonuclease [Saprospiraceae bacterium]